MAIAAAVLLVAAPPDVLAQAAPVSVAPAPSTATSSRGVWAFLGGAATGLGAHELGHLLFNVVFDAEPGVKRISFKGVPFFAITHRRDLSPRREYAVSSAGLWVQHAASEWILTHEPDLRDRDAPFRKGWLAFNTATSAVYAGAALARGGPPERDTRSMAASRGLDERWMGILILGPAVLDALRYFRPGSEWATWTSRGMKVGLVLLVLK